MRTLDALGKRLRAMRRKDTDDQGAMLIIALIIVTVVALVTGAILGHGWVNLRSTTALRTVANTSYAADAAAKVAINELRQGSDSPDWVTPSFDGSWNSGTWGGWVFTNNSDGTGCFGAIPGATSGQMTAQDNLELKKIAPPAGDQSGNTSARVECTPVDGTGIFSGGAGVVIGDPNATDPFSQALVTDGAAGAAGGDGVYSKVLGSGNHNTVPIGGGVASKSTVSIDNGTMTTDGFVHAETGCSGTIISSDTKCNLGAGGVTAPTVSDLLSTLPTPIYDATSTYPAPVSGKCAFTAGTYASGAALSTAVNKCTVAYFASGQYYFDFQDAKESDRVWKIGAVQIVGGEPTGSLSIPGTCQSAIGTDNHGKGVQFVFGGSSRLTFGSDSAVELCGPNNASGTAPMTIFQQQTSGPAVTVTSTPTATPTTTTTSYGPESAGTVSTAPFVNNVTDPFKPVSGTGSLTPAMLASAGDTTGAKWTSTKAKNNGELDLSNFADSIPAGATISSATLSIALAARSSDVSPTVYVNGQSNAVGTALSTTSTNNIDVTSALTTAMPATGSLQPSVQIKIPIGGSGQGAFPASGSSVTVDQVTLTVTYTTTSAVTPPPVTTTVKLEPWSSTLPFIQSAGGATAHPAQWVVQGATYAPNGFIDIEDSQADLVAFRWGIQAQGVSFKTYPQQLFGFPLVSIPAPGSSLGPRVTGVDLKVYVCVGSDACSAGGILALTTRVLITDPTYTSHPTTSVRQIRVLSWARLH